MRTVEIIEKKRDGGTLTPEEIRFVIGGYTRGDVPDYQMAALLMAVFFRGLSGAELAVWTEAMLRSGEVLDLSSIPLPKVDKHSTGGVGDKVSIPLAPMVGACGVAVPMMSGRGLGHTGGTLDKLESIPGFRTAYDPDEFVERLRRTGVVLAGQSESLVPADRKMYALRDATATVPSIPLIASSIMSKKLAEDLDGLVLDVKVGRGAFMREEPEARELARTMVDLGARHGVRVTAYLTNMDQPLGREVGNANEIAESIDVLRGGGPDDLVELVYLLGAEMLHLAGVTSDHTEARGLLEKAVKTGAALERFAAIVENQGGDPRVIEDPDILPQPRHLHVVEAERKGYVTRCDARAVGIAAMRLGAGRERKEDTIDPAVGITVLAKEGDAVDEGQPLARIGYNDEDRLASCLEALSGAWAISTLPASPRPLVLGEVRP